MTREFHALSSISPSMPAMLDIRLARFIPADVFFSSIESLNEAVDAVSANG
jgi:hypothetical protein